MEKFDGRDSVLSQKFSSTTTRLKTQASSITNFHLNTSKQKMFEMKNTNGNEVLLLIICPLVKSSVLHLLFTVIFGPSF